MKYLDEQLQLYQADCIKAREENNELRLIQTKNNAELSQVVENYDIELNKARTQLEATRSETVRLRNEVESAARAQQEIVEEKIKLNGQIERERMEWEKEKAKMYIKISRAKNEAQSADKQAEEATEARVRQSKFSEEQQRQM